MINIDDRLIGMVTGNELLVLCAIAKMMDVKRQAFPSNETLSKVSGLSCRTVQRMKRSLEQKQIIQTQFRSTEVGRQTSSLTMITTDMIGVFVSLKGAGGEVQDIDYQDGDKMTYRGRQNDVPGASNLRPRGRQNDVEVGDKMTPEVLIQKEVLGNEEVLIEEDNAHTREIEIDTKLLPELKQDFTVTHKIYLWRQEGYDIDIGEKIEMMIDFFGRHAKSNDKIYTKYSDFKKHFYNWAPGQMQRLEMKRGKNNARAETASVATLPEYDDDGNLLT